jgi:polyferredoxin
MVLCDNVFCSGEVIEFEYITIAGRRFCCVACAEAWYQQNEVLAEAAMPLHETSKKEPRGRITIAPRRNALT